MGLLNTAVSVVATVERTMWGLVRARMDAASPPPARPSLTVAPEPRFAASPRDMMTALLSESLEHDALSSEREYLVAVLRQLLPDEARIIAALADGAPASTVSVYRRGTSDVLLSNASLIGRTAAVTLPSRTTRYVAHLLHLGLVETGPEDKANEVGYEMVLADREVRPALKEGALGKLPARVERKTLRLSEHGRALWEATRPDVTE
ncbi:DUF4393 domain-containing protein [Nocardioides humilatus]|uniref:DUF4393 domain-containing protein n=1 Tax=Nocardioides humilatus TaxID=2607660 RepID=A0A5B1LI98_9ACTN|nr:Abi-alpha family protein [Nocardioides humilatus]KAA1419307.1 DUF4393 domain-containing protein [Nocardioides humilatus]